MLHRPPSRRSQAAKAGELLTEMKQRGERQKPGGNQHKKGSRTPLLPPPKLSDLGINKTQSSRSQQRQRRRDQQRRHRQRQRDGRRVYAIELNADIIGALIKLEWLTDAAAADDHAVGCAVARLLSEAASALPPKRT